MPIGPPIGRAYTEGVDLPLALNWPLFQSIESFLRHHLGSASGFRLYVRARDGNGEVNAGSVQEVQRTVNEASLKELSIGTLTDQGFSNGNLFLLVWGHDILDVTVMFSGPDELEVQGLAAALRRALRPRHETLQPVVEAPPMEASYMGGTAEPTEPPVSNTEDPREEPPASGEQRQEKMQFHRLANEVFLVAVFAVLIVVILAAGLS